MNRQFHIKQIRSTTQTGDDFNSESFKKLQEVTEEFFKLHIPTSSTIQPIWSKPWTFIGTIPNNKYKGCYAHFNESAEIEYIGSAIGKGSKGKYYGHGIGNRVSNYKKRDLSSGMYQPRKKYKHIDHIRTIRLNNDSEDLSYLAASLEIYLIQKLKPGKNKLLY